MRAFLCIGATLLFGCGGPCHSPLEEWERCAPDGSCPTLDEVAADYCGEGGLNPFLDYCGEFTIVVENDGLFGSEEAYDAEGNLAFARVCGDTPDYCAGAEACHVYGEIPDCETVLTNDRLCDKD